MDLLAKWAVGKMSKYTEGFSLIKKNWQKGFTFAEAAVSMAVIAILFGIVIFNLAGEQNRTTLRSTIDTLLSDVRSQQLKTMVGVRDGKDSAGNYGVIFMQNSYVLFHGSFYSASDPSNFVVSLPSNVQISSTGFADNTIIFSAVGGEIAGFLPAGNMINLKEVNQGREVTIKLNKYGVVTGGY